MMRKKFPVWFAFGVLATAIALGGGASAEDKPAGDRPLEKALKEQSEGFAKKAPPEIIKAFEEGIKKMAESGIIGMAPKVGDKVELFELPGADGKVVKL